MAELHADVELAVVGDAGVGKSCLVERFAENYYAEPCKRVSSKIVNKKMCVINICVWRDTCSKHKPADGYLVVFDVTNKSSLLNVPSWFQEVEAYSKPCLKVLVGNKSDCNPLTDVASARLFAEEDKVAYFSVSARDGSLVHEAFLTLISEVMKMKARNSEHQLSYKGGKTTVPVQTKQITDWGSLYHSPLAMYPFEQSTRLFDDIAYAHSVAKTAEMAKRDAEAKAQKAENEAYCIKSGNYAKEIDEKAIGVKVEVAQWKQKSILLEKKVQELTKQCGDLQRSNDDWKNRTLSAEQTNRALNDKCTAAEREAAEEKQKAQQQEQRATVAEREIHSLMLQLRSAEDRATTAEQQAREALDMLERRQCHWVVSPDEVKLSSGTIGTGGWAEVKRGQFRGLTVAVKSLHHIILTPHNRSLFMREMTIAAQVRHPNLVQFLGATTEGHPMIIMELMPTSLRAVLEDPARAERGLHLSDKQIISIAADVAKALNYLHLIKPKAIIHRDISSANVLMEQAASDTGWRAKLSDYGSANFVCQVRTPNPGCAAYAAPESLNPTKQSPKMDVFSFGVLLIEMFTHKFPDSKTRDQMLSCIKHPIAKTIRKCLQEEPLKRPNIKSIYEELCTSLK